MKWPWTRKTNTVRNISRKLNTIIEAEKEKETLKQKRRRERRIQKAEQAAEERLQQIELINSENLNYSRRKHPALLQRYGLTGRRIEGLPFYQWMEFQKELRNLRKQNKLREKQLVEEEAAESERQFQERLRLNLQAENNPVLPSYIQSRSVTPTNNPRGTMGGKRTRKHRKH